MRSLLCTAIFLFSSVALHAQDWPNLSHFKEQNKQLPKKAEGEQRVVLMGNSITIGWLQTHPEFFENNPYINRGISCLLYTSPSPRDATLSRMPSSA